MFPALRSISVSEATNLGILKGSEYVIDPEKIGYETCAYIGIYLKDPESFDSVTKALEAIPEVWNAISLLENTICLLKFTQRTTITY
mgnify:CR=1 FL=1